MLETIATFIIMGIVTAFTAFAGYVILVGDREEADANKTKPRSKNA